MRPLTVACDDPLFFSCFPLNFQVLAGSGWPQQMLQLCAVQFVLVLVQAPKAPGTTKTRPTVEESLKDRQWF